MSAPGSRTQVDLHILDESVFRSIVTREQRRAERRHRALNLLILEPSPSISPLPPLTWHIVADAILAVKGDAAMAGWLRHGQQIGVIPADITHSDDPASHCERFETILQREFAARFRAAGGAPFSFPFRVSRRDSQVCAIAHWPAPHAHARRHQIQRTIDDALKRGLDVIVSLALLVLLMPLLVLIAALVKWGSPGPALFRQVRIGHLMTPFTLLKFRTMYSHADPAVHQAFVSSFIKAQREADQAGSNGLFKLTNDSRVTPLGRILRRTSLDELPQLWNVLRGDMSLVGPRPPLAYELEQYQPWHRRRLLEAKPGVTGLWQVVGRSRTTFDEMVRLDLRYARTRSFWTDVKILLATPAAVITGKGAC